jgi:hypothetical protein
MSRPTTLTWIGARNANGQPLEWFAGEPGCESIPAMDMDAETVAGLTEAQWTKIESPAGQRLYAGGKASVSTASRPSGTSVPAADG